MNFKTTLIGLICLLAFQASFSKTLIFTPEEPQPDSSYTIKDLKKKSGFNISSDIVSTHMWRGISAGTAPCIEPLINWTNGGLSLNTWTAYAVDNSYREIDLFATYKWKFIEVGLFDYYCPTPDLALNDFSRFKGPRTQHLYEAQMIFYGNEKWPFKITTACFLGGADFDKDMNQLYSSYLEVAYQFKLKDVELNLEVGMTPAESMYAKEASIFNCGFAVSKSIKVNQKWEIPALYKLIYNLEQKELYFMVSFTLS